MNILTIFLQAAGAAAAPQQAPAGGGWSLWIMLGLMFLVMWFFMIRPQRRQQKELEKFRNALKKGDKIVTIGGIYGTVDSISDRTVIIKVDEQTKLKVDKGSLVKDFSETRNQ